MTTLRNPRKILAIKLRAMGDTILMTAPLQALRDKFPRAEIHAVTLNHWAPLLQGHPAVQKTWEFERHQDPVARARAATRLAFKLRAERFDCVINFHASPTSSLISFATGAPVRSIHFHGHTDKNRYTTVEIPGKGEVKPIIERDMDAIRALGVEVESGRLPKVYLLDGEKSDAQARLRQLKLEEPLLAIGLGASRPTKRWSMERFASLAIMWCQQRRGTVMPIIGPGEMALGFEFESALEAVLQREIADEAERRALRKKIVALTPQPIRTLAAMLSQAQVLVGNDSGPRHLAVAVGRPTVTLFGPEHPYEWHPYPESQHPKFFIDALACRKDGDPGKPAWCGLEVCVAEQHRCMRDIDLHRVWEAIERLAK